MLATVVESNGMKPYLDKVVTVEEVKLFKTAPQSYQLLLDAFHLEKSDVLFVSSNAWDAVGAAWFGLDVAWVNRQKLPFEEIGIQPKFELGQLAEVLKTL